MKAIAAYMATKHGEDNRGREDRQYEYREPVNREYENRAYNERQPNQYHVRNGMDEEWPEGNAEMRRRRDSRGRYMTDDDGMDDDARAYDARNEYMPPRDNYGRVESRYMPEYPIIGPTENRAGLYDGGGIGFGTRDREYQTRSHYDDGMERGGNRQEAQVGGTMWMEPMDTAGGMKMDRETAERWMRTMRNEDSARPTGARWSMDELKPMAQKFGIKPDTEEFYEFAVMTNAMYSDYCNVAKKFNVTSPEFYGMLAIAWMKDKDAMPNKTALYYQYIVKK